MERREPRGSASSAVSAASSPGPVWSLRDDSVKWMQETPREKPNPLRGNARRAEEQASHRDLVPLLTVSRHFHHFRRLAVDPEAWSMTFFVP